MRVLGAVMLLVFASCSARGNYLTVGDATYAETDAHDVVVLDEAPPDGELVAVVEGIDSGVLGSALDDARRLAAEAGADAIVVTGHGRTTPPLTFMRVKTLRADAYRLR